MRDGSRYTAGCRISFAANRCLIIVMRHDLRYVAYVCRRSTFVAAAAVLISCGRTPSDSTIERPLEEGHVVKAMIEQIAQARRQAHLISEEMRSIQGPGVRATVERAGNPCWSLPLVVWTLVAFSPSKPSLSKGQV